ncbi:MAG: nucleoside deaminase [Cryobacterium sp.]|nr:nucleoside deaminase [Oligoflexia bacterium]
MTLEKSDYANMIRRTIVLAELSVKDGNHPFGALLVTKEGILLEGQNTVNSDKDVTRHAELNLVSKASRELSVSDLSASTLFSSTEPCAMCAAAIYWVGIRHIVFGCSSEKLEKIAGKTLRISSREVLATTADPVFIEGPILESEACVSHVAYWGTADS